MKTELMGVVNVTPDSYYDGGLYADTERAVRHALELVEAGADIIDIGGESTRPPQIYSETRGPSVNVSIEEELRRVIPVIEELQGKISVPISIDTRKPEVAKEALKAGANILNDVSGFSSEKMLALATEYQVPICCMHMQGSFQKMQENPSYSPDATTEIFKWFQDKLKVFHNQGIKKENIILDPGICFGKTLEHNLDLIHNTEVFKELGCKLLIGASRKSLLGKIVGKDPIDLLPATLAMSAYLIMKGVDILRVHDVQEHQDLRKVLDVLMCKQHTPSLVSV